MLSMAEGEVDTTFPAADQRHTISSAMQTHPSSTVISIPGAAEASSAPLVSSPLCVAQEDNHATTATRRVGAEVTVGGYRIHPSALAVPTMVGTNNITSTSAAEQMAAIAASDQGSRSSQDNTHPQTASTKACKRASDLFSRSLPVFLLAIVAYVYYVFVFRVCSKLLLKKTPWL